MVILIGHRLQAQLRDLRARHQLRPFPACTSCGGDLENWTFGCKRCCWRFAGKAKRGAITPERYEQLRRENLAWTWMESQRLAAEGRGGSVPVDSYYVLYPMHLAGSKS